jgi:lipopolysaccharide export system protein LptC
MRKSIKYSIVVWSAGAIAACFNFFPPLLHFSAYFVRPAIADSIITMKSPKYSGFTRDGSRRYELSAASLAQDIGHGEIINLEEPRMSLELADGRTLKASATTGVFNAISNVLTLRPNVTLAVRTGSEIHLSEAVIDLRNSTLISERPFEIESEEKTLRGNRLEISESGTIVIVDGTLIRSGNIIRFDRYALP